MELLEFKNKMLTLCNVDDVSAISDILLEAALSNNTMFFDEFNEIISEDTSKDWLQHLWQYYEADRTEKKQDYTPKSLCKLVSALVGDCSSIYDCCGGSGALTLQNLKDKPIDDFCVEELDNRVIPFLVFNLALHNASGIVVNGDVLTQEKYRIFQLHKGEKYSYVSEIQKENFDGNKKFQCSISNPPYNIVWDAPSPLFADERFPVIPPKNNANWAFALNCISKADKAVLILPNGIATERSENEVRQYLVDNDLVELVAIMPGKMFEATSISTCIVVLNKNKQNKGFVKFVDSRKNCVSEEREQNGQFGGASHTNRTYKKSFNVLSDENIDNIINAPANKAMFSATKSNKEVAEEDYVLMPSRYIDYAEAEEIHRPFHEIAESINYIIRMQNSCKLVINETIAKKLGLDIDAFCSGKQNSKQLREQMKPLGIDVEIEDYIQFTKNKNEFAFKCNDKEIFPDILLQFLSIWKNQIALLNTMQNKYLQELRDALLPKLMSGEIEL